MTIPVSQVVAFTPGVIGGGGTGLALTGLCLTNSTRVPIGTVQSFPAQPAVAAYFGAASPEAALATTYFAGWAGSNIKPAAMLFAQYPSATVAAYLRGSNVAALTTSQLKAVNGSITVSVNGTPITAGINLSAATSFTSAATIIGTALGVGCSFDVVSGGFLLVDATPPTATSTISFATSPSGDNTATTLGLTQASGALVSAGSSVATPSSFMAGIVNQTTNFLSFFTAFEPSVSDKVSFAQWNSGAGNRYLYAHWTTEAAAAISPDSTSSGALIIQAGYGGTVLTYAPTNGAADAAFVAGFFASLDPNEVNGTATLAFKGQSGLPADVTSGGTSSILLQNGYNFVGSYSLNANTFTFMYPGSITGPYNFADNYVNSIQLGNALQLAMIELLTTVKSIPYNTAGDGLIKAAAADPIQAGVNFGSIAGGLNLSALQRAEVNALAGMAIDTTLATRGWYLLSNAAGASSQVRAARGSPQIMFIYTSGESVQAINVSSVSVL